MLNKSAPAARAMKTHQSLDMKMLLNGQHFSRITSNPGIGQADVAGLFGYFHGCMLGLDIVNCWESSKDDVNRETMT